jgi:ligand-binding SRPBCC domain-containing protein
MPTIHLTTFIEAPVDRVFDLSRSIELHKESMKKYQEDAAGGTRFGLVEKEDVIIWRAKHFFKTRYLKVKITALKKPETFTDEQVEGNFKIMKHEHHFKPCDNGTIMIDLFSYDVPYGSMGKIFDKVCLKKYMSNLLFERNKVIKDFAESNKWKRLLIK